MKYLLFLLFFLPAVAGMAQSGTAGDSVKTTTSALTQTKRRYKIPEGQPFAEMIQAANLKWLIDTLASSGYKCRMIPGKKTA